MIILMFTDPGTIISEISVTDTAECVPNFVVRLSCIVIIVSKRIKPLSTQRASYVAI